MESLWKDQECLTNVVKFGPFPCTILYKSRLLYPSWQATSFERPPSWMAFIEGFHCILWDSSQFDGLGQERRNSSALAMELCLSWLTQRFVLRYCLAFVYKITLFFILKTRMCDPLILVNMLTCLVYWLNAPKLGHNCNMACPWDCIIYVLHWAYWPSSFCVVRIWLMSDKFVNVITQIGLGGDGKNI